MESVPRRAVYDLSDWSKCECVLPLGTSGQVASPFYDNMFEVWLKDEYVPMLWEEADIEENKMHELTLSATKDIGEKTRDCVLL